MSNLVIVGAQWGDEGKGKVIDLLSEEADAVVRFQGGSNAGHTVVFGGQKHVLHLIPCGILHPGKVCVIGNGVVIDPTALFGEIDTLREGGIEVNGDNLKVSELAPVTFPYHKAMDVANEAKRGKGKIDTTHRGIGPTYTDKYARIGIRVVDLLDESRLRRRLESILAEKNFLFEKYFDMPSFQLEEVLLQYANFGQRLRPFVTDAAALINSMLDQKKRILFEGAQGTFLDVDFGTYPYVTASHPTSGGACIGSGVGPTRIEQVLGIVKAYTTRVGAGPLPTEAEHGGEDLRRRGNEFGATTGRPRRCGWFDAVVVRRAKVVNGFEQMALTKLDVLSGIPKLKICTAYEIDGQRITSFPAALEDVEKIKPVYEEMDGWEEDIRQAKTLAQLPVNARKYISRIEELIGVKISLISLGEDRKQTLLLDRFLS